MFASCICPQSCQFISRNCRCKTADAKLPNLKVCRPQSCQSVNVSFLKMSLLHIVEKKSTSSPSNLRTSAVFSCCAFAYKSRMNWGFHANVVMRQRTDFSTFWQFEAWTCGKNKCSSIPTEWCISLSIVELRNFRYGSFRGFAKFRGANTRWSTARRVQNSRSEKQKKGLRRDIRPTLVC